MPKTPQRRRLKFTHAMQFRIELLDTTPPVWRRFQIPDDCTFWELHCAITDVMPWKDYHLHMFKIRSPKRRKAEQIGIPDDDAFEGDIPIRPGWKVLLQDYFVKAGQRAQYIYDFGDDWIHGLLFEGEVEAKEGVRYPICLEGEMAGPPDDCGGLGGFENFKKAMQDPTHPEHAKLKRWYGRPFDPARFDAKAVRFLDPLKRFKVAFCGEIPPAEWAKIWNER